MVGCEKSISNSDLHGGDKEMLRMKELRGILSIHRAEVSLVLSSLMVGSYRVHCTASLSKAAFLFWFHIVLS